MTAALVGSAIGATQTVPNATGTKSNATGTVPDATGTKSNATGAVPNAIGAASNATRTVSNATETVPAVAPRGGTASKVVDLVMFLRVFALISPAWTEFSSQMA
ncbi:MAG TPA: hypothetical protein VK157_07015 [Phycisphaerales bacterium]|nr:hypothetical protein [Phycisphaerales bacterium]